MSNHTDIVTYSNWDQMPNRVLRWLGDDTTRNDSNTWQPLQRDPNESSHGYFSRWLQSYGATLNWKVDFYPDAQKDRCVLWRPIVNGLDLSACGVGFGASSLDEERAKEDACEAIIKAQPCLQRI